MPSAASARVFLHSCTSKHKVPELECVPEAFLNKRCGQRGSHMQIPESKGVSRSLDSEHGTRRVSSFSPIAPWCRDYGSGSRVQGSVIRV